MIIIQELDGRADKICHLEFGLYCVKTVQKLVNNENVDNCIEIIENWLLNPKNVSINELDDFSNYVDYNPKNSYAAKYCKDALMDLNRAFMNFFNHLWLQRHVKEAINSIVYAKTWAKHPDRAEGRIEFKDTYKDEYSVFRAKWRRRWDKPDPYLKELCDKEGDVVLDYLQDTGLINHLIPFDGQYYLILPCFKDEFVGRSRDEVIDKILSSAKKPRILHMIKDMA